MAESLTPESAWVRSALGAMLTETVTGDAGEVLVALTVRAAAVTPSGSDTGDSLFWECC
jgi:hypothetical protein